MKHEITITVLIDEDGNYAVGADDDAAKEAWEGVSDNYPSRMLHIELQVEVPAPTVLTATVPAQAGAVEMKVSG